MIREQKTARGFAFQVMLFVFFSAVDIYIKGAVKKVPNRTTRIPFEDSCTFLRKMQIKIAVFV